jgi:hypothetical protein
VPFDRHLPPGPRRLGRPARCRTWSLVRRHGVLRRLCVGVMVAGILTGRAGGPGPVPFDAAGAVAGVQVGADAAGPLVPL